MAISDFLTPEQANLLLDQQFSSPQGIARLNPLAFQYEDAFTPYSERQMNALKTMRLPSKLYEPSYSDPAFFSDTLSGYNYDPYLGTKENNFNYLFGTRPAFKYETMPETDPSRFTGVDLESGYLDRAGSSDQDVYSEKPKSFRDSANLKEYSQNRSLSQGLEALLQYLPFGEKSLIGYLGDKILPKESPEVKGMKRFYRDQYGLDPVGRVASGIMAGYNPVSGGLLNMITGGKYGKPTRFGLAGAMQKRIENILGRRAAQTDASRARVEELRNLQLKEMQDRADRGESLSSIGKSTFSGKGKAFEAKPSGAYSKGFAGGR
jgi:hypothetical protein